MTSVVLVGERADVRELRDVAVHREDAVRRDEPDAAGPRLLQALVEFLHVRVRVPEPLGLAKPHAVDDRRVVERVGDDRVLLAEDRLEKTAVRVEARRVEDSVVQAQERGERLLELLVEVLRAADEAGGAQAVAVRVERAPRGRDDFRMEGEAEVVVRAEVEDFLSADPDRRALRAQEDALFLEETRLADRGELGLEDPGQRGLAGFLLELALFPPARFDGVPGDVATLLGSQASRPGISTLLGSEIGQGLRVGILGHRSPPCCGKYTCSGMKVN
jgi:hypothetical protein